jgi:hypothetical protein
MASPMKDKDIGGKSSRIPLICEDVVKNGKSNEGKQR